eukprot:scaffold290920_cov14-Tisochrysis_lutea.AAC.1
MSTYIHTALQEWTLLTQGKRAMPLSFTTSTSGALTRKTLALLPIKIPFHPCFQVSQSAIPSM